MVLLAVAIFFSIMAAARTLALKPRIRSTPKPRISNWLEQIEKLVEVRKKKLPVGGVCLKVVETKALLLDASAQLIGKPCGALARAIRGEDVGEATGGPSFKIDVDEWKCHCRAVPALHVLRNSPNHLHMDPPVLAAGSTALHAAHQVAP